MNKLTKPLEEHSTTELVKLFNSLVPAKQRVSRFSTKEAAIKRVRAVLPPTEADADVAAGPLAEPYSAEDTAPAELTSDTAPTKGKGQEVSAVEEAPSSRSPKESSAPTKRHSAVAVEGPGGPYEYSSVAVAFKALGLPFGKHQLFRKKLKAAGSLVIDRYTFHTAN